MKNKKCCKCEQYKPLNMFSLQKTSKDGYYCVCKDCKNEYDKSYRDKNKNKIKERKKNYYLSNKDTVNASNKEYYSKNKDVIKQYQKEYREKNKEKAKQYQKEYREKNKIKRNEYNKERKKNDEVYKLTCNYRSMICDVFRRNGYSKNSKTYDILGCSFDEFKQHIESQWEDWMTWDNYGKYNGEAGYGWDIDHITPISSAINEGEVIKLNHYTNLQPLCSYLNRDVKIDKI